MARIFEAVCSASGKVSIEGFEIPDAIVLGSGKAESQGAAVIDGGKVTYIPNNVSNVIGTLDGIINSLQQITAALTKLDGKPTGGTGSAPVALVTGEVTQLNNIRTQLDQLKGALK